MTYTESFKLLELFEFVEPIETKRNSLTGLLEQKYLFEGKYIIFFNKLSEIHLNITSATDFTQYSNNNPTVVLKVKNESMFKNDREFQDFVLFINPKVCLAQRLKLIDSSFIYGPIIKRCVITVHDNNEYETVCEDVVTYENDKLILNLEIHNIPTNCHHKIDIKEIQRIVADLSCRYNFDFNKRSECLIKAIYESM